MGPPQWRRRLNALWRLLEVLDKLEIAYAVAGSIASSVYGIPRMTNDVDVVVDLPTERIPELVSELRADFYVDVING